MYRWFLLGTILAMALAACTPNGPIDTEPTSTLSATPQTETTSTPSPFLTFTPAIQDKVIPSPRPTRTPTLIPACESYKVLDVNAFPQKTEGKYQGWRLYIHPQYHYSVLIPLEWGACIRDHYLNLFFLNDRRVLTLVIGTKFADDEPHILRTGVPAGDVVDGGTVQFLGQTIRKRMIRYEGKDKVVLYGYKEDLPYQIPAGNLIFTISLDDFSDRSYEEIELSPEIQQLADEIVESIQLSSP